MDQYGLAFLTIASVYVVWSIFSYMLTHCHRRHYIQEIADALRGINARLQSAQFEAVCLCYDCMKRNESQRRASIASVHALNASKIEDAQAPEHVAIGIQNGDDHT
jgi:hypothetical protein